MSDPAPEPITISTRLTTEDAEKQPLLVRGPIHGLPPMGRYKCASTLLKAMKKDAGGSFQLTHYSQAEGNQTYPNLGNAVALGLHVAKNTVWCADPNNVWTLRMSESKSPTMQPYATALCIDGNMEIASASVDPWGILWATAYSPSNPASTQIIRILPGDGQPAEGNNASFGEVVRVEDLRHPVADIEFLAKVDGVGVFALCGNDNIRLFSTDSGGEINEAASFPLPSDLIGRGYRMKAAQYKGRSMLLVTFGDTGRIGILDYDTKELTPEESFIQWIEIDSASGTQEAALDLWVSRAALMVTTKSGRVMYKYIPGLMPVEEYRLRSPGDFQP